MFHVLYALTHKPDLFSVASITDGDDLSYWLYLLWTDIPWAQQYAELMNGGAKPFGNVGLLKWAKSAPGFNLEHVRSPLLISCLEKGMLVGSWDIYGGLRRLGKPVDLVWLRKEDAPHVLVQPHHRYLSQQEAVDWFDFWLNGREDNDWQRWQSTRAGGSCAISEFAPGHQPGITGPMTLRSVDGRRWPQSGAKEALIIKDAGTVGPRGKSHGSVPERIALV